MDLMTPRVIVTAWYPGCPFKVGDVLALGEDMFGQRYESKDAKYTVWNIDVEKATSNFRALSWYEHRKVEDMPRFLRCEDGTICPVVYQEEDGTMWICPDRDGVDLSNNANWEWVGSVIENENLLPATLQEYTDYVNSKK